MQISIHVQHTMVSLCVFIHLFILSQIFIKLQECSGHYPRDSAGEQDFLLVFMELKTRKKEGAMTYSFI